MYIATSQTLQWNIGLVLSAGELAFRRTARWSKSDQGAGLRLHFAQLGTVPPVDFRHFLERDIIEISTLRRLENSGHFNWWCHHDSNHRLPLAMTGDGKCLLHTASLEMGKLEVPNLIGRTKSIGNITLRQFANRIFEELENLRSEEELLVTDANRKCNPLELLHLLSGMGIRSPIMARVDYGAANNKEHKPGLNYLDRWEIKGKVPAKWVQCLHESMQKGEFETQEEVEKMLEEFKGEEGAPMAEMLFKETDGVVDKRMAAVIKAAGKRECGDNYWVMEPADYFVAGVRKLVVVAGDNICANGTSIRDKMAHFLLPDDTHWGDEAGPEMKGKDGLGKRIKKFVDRYEKGLDAVAESYGKLESAWPPSEKEYQDLAQNTVRS